MAAGASQRIGNPYNRRLVVRVQLEGDALPDLAGNPTGHCEANEPPMSSPLQSGCTSLITTL